MSKLISSNISPTVMAEMNREDAKQIDVALGVIVNEIPSKIAYIKNVLDEVATSIASLKTVSLGFTLNTAMENVAKSYDTFSQEAINCAALYELKIVKIINIFDRQNSEDGSGSIDNNFFQKLPFLGTMLFSLLGYFGNGNMVDDFPELALDIAGNHMDKGFNESLGNLIYNAAEYIGELRHWKFWRTNITAGVSLIAVESLYEILWVNTDHRQDVITGIEAFGDGCKLVAGNAIAKYVAIPFAQTTATGITTALAGTAFANVTIGGVSLAHITGVAGGGLVGAGIVVLGELTLDFVIDPIVDELTGESYVYLTSIQKNGGIKEIYSSYVKQIEHNYSYSPIGRTTSLYGMTVSYEYCHEMAQVDPVGTLLGLDDYGYTETSYSTTQLENYIADLKAIPKDSANFQEQVDQLTANALVGDGTGYGTDYIRNLLYDLDFDPYNYAMNN